jgi:hypothetical protein
MHKARFLALSLALFSIQAISAGSETAQSILEKMQQKQIERWEGVDSYVVEQTIMGNRVQLYYERITVAGPNGKEVPSFRTITNKEVVRRRADAQGQQQMDATQMELFAEGMDMLGEGMGKEIEDGMQAAGLPPGMLAATGSDPWATFDPRVMMGGNATMMRAMAADKAKGEDDGVAAARENLAQTSDLADRARLVGTESTDGKQAFHLRAEGLNQVQKADDREFIVQSVDMWIDSRMYVPLKTKVAGVVKSAEGTTPMTIDLAQTDYRTVPGSKMYEPYKRDMRMAGLMSPEQEKEMQEARQKMAEFEKQMATMDPAQRQMMMNMMGPQMEMMRNMGSGGGFQMVTTVDSIRVGETPEDVSPGSAAARGPAGAPGSMASRPGEPPMPVQAPPAETTPARDPAALKTAQQACLAQKVQQAKATQKKKSALGSLMSAVSRTASQFGVNNIGKVTSDVYSANASASDIASAAKDLGLTEDDIAACQNPM